jgi:chromate reductase
MKMKILCFGASSSRESINRKLAIYASSIFSEAEVVILDLNDFLMPIFSVDIEKESGIPEKGRIWKSFSGK